MNDTNTKANNWKRQHDLDSMQNNLNQILTQIEHAKQEVQKALDFVDHDDALADHARWVDIGADIQKKIISLPSQCQLHRLGQIAHSLESQK